MTSGMHNFSCDAEENFPPSNFNRSIFSLNLAIREINARSLDDGECSDDYVQIYTKSIRRFSLDL